MSSDAQYYTINIERNIYSYGFELKDEGKVYKKYALISKITNNVASERGLKVGDKVVSINGEKVAGKDYISLRNNIRKSLDNCVRLEILKEANFQMICPDLLSPEPTFTPMKLSFGRSLIPTGSIREKISMFQDSPHDSNIKTVTGQSNSCDCINKCVDSFDEKKTDRIGAASVDNLLQHLDSFESEPDLDNIQTISQDPFIDDSIFVPHDCVQIQLSSSDFRVIESKSVEHIETPPSVQSYETIFEHVSEPSEDNTLSTPQIPKLEINDSTPNFNLITDFCQLSPIIMINKSRSSNNIFEDVTANWSGKPLNDKNNPEFGSMSNINSSKTKFFGEKKLPRQQTILKNIPIKLRILQFHDRVKSKGWKDYIMEPEPNGARFRKRILENNKPDRVNNFIIRLEDVNKFEIDSPHRRHKNDSGNDVNIPESLLKYNLMAFNNRVQLKFHFNPSIFQDDESSSRAGSTFKEIINSFKAAGNVFSHPMNIHSLSQSMNINIPLCETQRSVTTVKDINSSMEDSNSDTWHNSATNSYKSISKSSAENISATTFEISQSSSRSIFRQAIGKIKPEKKIKVTQTYQTFTGTKAEYEEFQRQLEGGHLPLELESSDENGIHLNRFIYEVPRMSKNPKIPMIIYLCTEIIEKIGLKVEGIYRISGNQRVIRTLSNTLNKSLETIETSLPEWNNVHAVCGTLKLFLRKLKQYLIPADLSHVLAYSCKGVDCYDYKSLSKTLMDIRYHLSSYQIPSRRRSDSNIVDQVDCRWQSLQYILKHLSNVVSCKQYNSMDSHAISICFNPVIMESWQKNLNDIKADNEIMAKALKLILVHQDWLFGDWHSEMDCSWSSELVENAQKYAKEFIDRSCKESINPQRTVSIVDCIENEDVNIQSLVQEIVSQATLTFSEKRKIERRHSSHTPGQRPVILRDSVDVPDSGGLRRNSQTTDALDLIMCANWMKQLAKGSTINEEREVKMTYVPCTEPLFEINEPSDGQSLQRRRPMLLVDRPERYGKDSGVSGKDRPISPSEKLINSDNHLDK